MKQFQDWFLIHVILCCLCIHFVFFLFDQRATISFFVGALLSTSNVIFYFLVSYFLLKRFLHKGIFMYLFLGYLLKYSFLFLMFGAFFSKMNVFWFVIGFSTFILTSLIDRIKNEYM